jgi:outer membrane receptor protein involved in Fe transport
MCTMRISRWLLAMASILSVVAASGLSAQGVTTGAIAGVVTDSAGNPLEAVQIQVVNQATGYSSGGASRPDGRYFVSGLEVGGNYTVTARRVGYRPESKTGLRVALSQTLSVNFQLALQATQLEAVQIAADEDAVFSPTRTGVGTVISDSALRRLPTLNRNFTDFVRTTPQVSTTGSGVSGGGQNNRFNTIQIDGASETDVFGLGSTGQPGGQANGKAIPLEAVKEYQVLLAPYDVRQGNFTGLLVNAVTKSGTNDFKATGFLVSRNEELARNQDFIRRSAFDQTQYGLSIAGPIVKNKAHFFLTGEFQQRESPATGSFIGQSASSTTPLPISEADATRFANILRDDYDIEPGSTGAVINENPLSNIFARVDVQLNDRHRMVLRHNYGHAEDDVFGRSNNFDFSSYGYFFKSDKNATVGQLYSSFANGMNNELIVGYNRIRDERTPNVTAPSVAVTVANPAGGTATLRAGAEQFSQGNSLDQDVLEITNNFTIPMNSHRVTFGARAEFYHMVNVFTESSFGVYTFRNLDSLEAGNPSSYRVSTDLGGGIIADFNASRFALYAQDIWTASPRLTVTAGLRADVPRLGETPVLNPQIETLFGRRTNEVPSGNIQWSPRVGFNYDMSENGTSSQLRGGAGLFVGRPPFVWISNVFTNSGANLGILNCGTSGSPGPAPAFVSDPAAQPLACSNGQGIATGVVGPVNLLDEDLKFPQTFRASLGYDRDLGVWGLVGTVEGLYTRGVNSLFYVNRNLVGEQGVDRNGRVIYGDSIRTNGRSVPDLIDSRYSEVIDVTNHSADYSWSLTGQLQKRFDDRFEARASYTYSQARDIQSLGSSRAISNWRFGRTTSGSQLDETATTSLFDQPHKLQLSGTYTFPWQSFKTDLSLIYSGVSGAPHDYIYRNGSTSGSGDLNADGVQGNDLIYVPTDVSDPTEIMFRDVTSGSTVTVTAAQQAAAFENFINSVECLNEQRGRILERNSCRAPWANIIDLSLRQSLPAIQGHTLALQVDVFNFTNLLNKEWGQVGLVPGFNSNVPLLTHVGQTSGALAGDSGSQGIFQFALNQEKYNTQNLASNYQIQVSLRYSY